MHTYIHTYSDEARSVIHTTTCTQQARLYKAHLNPSGAEILLYKPKILFEYLAYGTTVQPLYIFHYFRAGMDFIRQNLLSIKSIPALKGMNE